jgi:hypothetical protein
MALDRLGCPQLREQAAQLLGRQRQAMARGSE